MIELLVVAQLVAATSQTSVTYRDVPPEVTRIVVVDPRGPGAPRAIAAVIARSAGRVVVRGVPDRPIVVSLARADGRYLLDGPFPWPATDVTRVLDHRWRRTLTAPPSNVPSGIASMEWVDVAVPPQSVWPLCSVGSDATAQCWGVANGQRGVAVGRGLDRLVWTVVSDDKEGLWRESGWGRMVIVRDGFEERDPPRIRFGRPAASSTGRTTGVRLETRAVDGMVSVPVAAGVAWIAGTSAPEDSWMEVTTSRGGPSFVPLPELAGGAAALPAMVTLSDRRVLTGTIVGARNEPGSVALLTIFRIIDADVGAGANQRRKPRRVFAAETIADAAGAFQIDGLGDAAYEAGPAFHPQLGRASVVLPEGRSDLTIRLQSSGSLRGRVLSGGKPAPGVEVTSVPDPDAFRAADDPLDVKGGDARTGADGRFTVMASASGGGELRIGGGRFPVRRVPLPRVPLPIVDLGDIDLGASITVTVVLDQDTPCGVRATGPVGRSGLQVVSATRVGPGLFQILLPETGMWNIGLLCGNEGRALVPAVVQIGSEHAGKEVRLAIR